MAVTILPPCCSIICFRATSWSLHAVLHVDDGCCVVTQLNGELSSHVIDATLYCCVARGDVGVHVVDGGLQVAEFCL